MKLLEKMRQQKLLSSTLLLVTLSIGIVIGTLVNTGVHAQHSGAAAPDATPLVVPKAAQVGKLVAERATKAGIDKVVFDRGGNRYTGRIAALADAAREAGLVF